MRTHFYQDEVVASHAKQAQPNHQHAGNSTTFKGYRECLIQTLGCGLRGSHIGTHRHIHTDVAGGTRQNCTDRKTNCSGGTKPRYHPDHDKQHHANNADRTILPIEIGAGASLNGSGNFLHSCVAGG